MPHPNTLLIAGLLWSLLASLGFADEFESYRRPDPKVFARGLAAYDSGNYAQAFEIWLPLARSGDLAAAFNVGLMLRDGRGIAKDQPRALSFFRKAAERGHLGSEVNVAEMYYRGIGTERDYLEAGRWLMILSRRGHYPSMYKLAGMFERGEGMETNPKAARTLYLIAYRGGYELAGNRLSKLAEEANESRAEPDDGSEEDATAALTEPEETRGPISGEGTPIPVLRLRGPIGVDGEDGTAATNQVFSLRKTIASMTSLERELYRIGWTAKTVPGKASPESDEPLGWPRTCQLRSHFDASATMCRMPPVRH